MKKFFTTLLSLVFISGSLQATNLVEPEDTPSDLLIIGARPWDQNLKDPSFDKVREAHFIDYSAHGGSDPLPKKFHLVDFNDNGVYSKESEDYKGPFTTPLSQFAPMYNNHFQTILFDLMTYQHVRRKEAWADLKSMLKEDGRLIVPVTCFRMREGDISKQKAQEFSKEVLESFFSTTVVSKENLPDDIEGIGLLKNPGLRQNEWGSHLDVYEDAIPFFIVAHKKKES